jgi:hypothetical protein
MHRLLLSSSALLAPPWPRLSKPKFRFPLSECLPVSLWLLLQPEWLHPSKLLSSSSLRHRPKANHRGKPDQPTP